LPYYPAWTSGQRVTAALITAMQPIIVVKAANTSRASTTTLAADPHLVLPVSAGATYLMDGWLEYDGNFGSPGDFKADWTLPSGGTLRWGLHSNAAGDTTQKYATTTASASTVVTAGAYGIGSTANGARPAGYLTTSAAGNITLRWAQNSSSATATTVYAGSWIRLQRVT
jgi:hypothetical protein